MRNSLDLFTLLVKQSLSVRQIRAVKSLNDKLFPPAHHLLFGRVTSLYSSKKASVELQIIYIL